MIQQQVRLRHTGCWVVSGTHGVHDVGTQQTLGADHPIVGGLQELSDGAVLLGDLDSRACLVPREAGRVVLLLGSEDGTTLLSVDAMRLAGGHQLIEALTKQRGVLGVGFCLWQVHEGEAFVEPGATVECLAPTEGWDQTHATAQQVVEWGVSAETEVGRADGRLDGDEAMCFEEFDSILS